MGGAAKATTCNTHTHKVAAGNGQQARTATTATNVTTTTAAATTAAAAAAAKTDSANETRLQNLSTIDNRQR